MCFKSCAMQLCLLIAIGLAFSATALAQTDAERFSEGRVALDKFKDCPAALKALEGVSPEGRKNPLWVFYMAKSTECLNRLDDALRFYEEYDRMMPGQTAILDKIGELRYRLGVQRREEAARTQKAEEDKRASEREAEDAKARLEKVLRGLNDELNASWKTSWEFGNEQWTITTSQLPSCQLRFTVRMERHLARDAGTHKEWTRFDTETQNVMLDIAKINYMFILDNYPDHLYISGEEIVLEGSWETASRWTDKGDKKNNGAESNNGSLLDKGHPVDSYELKIDKNLSFQSRERLKKAFELAAVTCARAQTVSR